MRDRRGTTALEFALVAPIVLMLLFGIFEFGRLIGDQHALDYGVDAAARYAIVSSGSATTSSITATFNSAVAPLLGGCTGCDVHITFNPSYARGNSVTITATYPWSPVAGLNILAAQTLSSSTTLTVQN